VLRSRDEGEGGEAAPVLRLTRADWLLENARVLTLDPRRPVARAIAIGGGRVLKLSSSARFDGETAAERIDCRGATIVPGLIDPHLHLFALAARRVNLDCGDAAIADVEGLLAAVRARAVGLPRDAWVRGEGLDETRLGRLPTAEELDAAADGRPVRLRHRSRHASLLSTEALRRLRGARADSSGVIAGREDLLGRVVGPLPPDAFAGALAAAATDLAAFGVTTVADATPHARRELAPLDDVMGAGRFALRVVAMRRVGVRTWPAPDRLLPGPIKILVEEDGAGLRPRPAILARRIARAAAAGQVAVHCVGASTLIAALAGFAALPRAARVGRRHRLEHVAECPPPLVRRIAALGLGVVTNPAFVHWRGDVYREETPGPAQSWLYRAATLARAGIPLAAGSDAPVVSENPWIAIAAARSRRTATGAVLGRAERLGAAAALRLVTTGAAFLLHADDLGRLVPGGPADLAVVEPDPLRAPPDEVAATHVRLTLAAGARVWGA